MPWRLGALCCLVPWMLLELASSSPNSDSLKVELYGRAFLIQPSEGLLPRWQAPGLQEHQSYCGDLALG
jgi:hypothetical protein